MADRLQINIPQKENAGSGGGDIEKFYSGFENYPNTSLTVTNVTFTDFPITPTSGSLVFTPDDMLNGAVYKIEFDVVVTAVVSASSSAVPYRWGFGNLFPATTHSLNDIIGQKNRCQLIVSFYGSTASSRNIHVFSNTFNFLPDSFNFPLTNNAFSFSTNNNFAGALELITTIDTSVNQTFKIQMRNQGGSGLSATCAIQFLRCVKIK